MLISDNIYLESGKKYTIQLENFDGKGWRRPIFQVKDLRVIQVVRVTLMGMVSMEI